MSQIKRREPTQCHYCGAMTTLKCSGCSKVSYCSKKCQKLDWSIHKRFCGSCTCCLKRKPLEACPCGSKICATCMPTQKHMCIGRSKDMRYSEITSCVICFDSLQDDGEGSCVTLRCGHRFHTKCVKELMTVSVASQIANNVDPAGKIEDHRLFPFHCPTCRSECQSSNEIYMWFKDQALQYYSVLSVYSNEEVECWSSVPLYVWMVIWCIHDQDLLSPLPAWSLFIDVTAVFVYNSDLLQNIFRELHVLGQTGSEILQPHRLMDATLKLFCEHRSFKKDDIARSFWHVWSLWMLRREVAISRGFLHE